MIGRIEKQLRSSEVDVRREAVLALKDDMGNRAEAVRLLFQGMCDLSWRVRKTAIDTLLGSYPPESYMVGLMKLIELEDNAGARNAAIEVFVRLGKRATEFLMGAFRTEDPDQRKFIIDMLARINDRKTLPLVVEALEDMDENVRAAAVEFLGTLKEPSVVDALMEILRKGELWTAYPAADALGRIGDPRAVPALREALGERSLREPAIRALGMIGDPAIAAEVAGFIGDKSRSVQIEALRALESLYRKGVAEKTIASALEGSLGEFAVDMLLDLSHGSKPESRVPAILLLGVLRDERAVDPLIEISADDEIADDVKRALAYIGRHNPACLLPHFSTEDIYVRRFIAGVAAEVGSPLFFDPLSSFLGNDDGHVRAMAAIGLAAIGDFRAVERLLPLLDDPYVDVQEAAVFSLGRLREGLDIAGLSELLHAASPALRRNATLLVGEAGGADVIETLGLMLKDVDGGVRRAAVSALCHIGTAEGYHLITQALTDETPEIRVKAVLCLGLSGRKDFARDLVFMLEDPDDLLKVSTAKALGMLESEEAVAALIPLLSNKNGFVVTAAIDSLGRLGGGLAYAALTDMLDSPDREIKRSAIQALAGFEQGVNLLAPFLDDQDWAVRVAAVESLSRHMLPHVRTKFEGMYDREDDPVVRSALNKALDA